MRLGLGLGDLHAPAPFVPLPVGLYQSIPHYYPRGSRIGHDLEKGKHTWLSIIGLCDDNEARPTRLLRAGWTGCLV